MKLVMNEHVVPEMDDGFVYHLSEGGDSRGLDRIYQCYNDYNIK